MWIQLQGTCKKSTVLSFLPDPGNITLILFMMTGLVWGKIILKVMAVLFFFSSVHTMLMHQQTINLRNKILNVARCTYATEFSKNHSRRCCVPSCKRGGIKCLCVFVCMWVCTVSAGQSLFLANDMWVGGYVCTPVISRWTIFRGAGAKACRHCF